MAPAQLLCPDCEDGLGFGIHSGGQSVGGDMLGENSIGDVWGPLGLRHMHIHTHVCMHMHKHEHAHTHICTFYLDPSPGGQCPLAQGAKN